jgi:S-methylmethionine-dependent homocysteine/selenocysteine methylase
MTNTSIHTHNRVAHLIDNGNFLTDGGLETDLIFNHGISLPCFASFDLLSTDWGRNALRDYYESYLDLAARHRAGFILESPTWRANRDWGEKIGYSAAELAAVNRQAIDFLKQLREQHRASAGLPVLISGNIGPRGDGYVADRQMTAGQAHIYHSAQLAVFAEATVDLVSAFTMNYVDEALGIVHAAREKNLPVVISFTVETDGLLPTGQSLGDAIAQVDDSSDAYVLYYMINCAHPTHFEQRLAGDSTWRTRIRGVRGNASKCSHAELDAAEELDAGNPEEFAGDYLRLQQLLPELRVYGGCCGTDLRHVERIARSCLATDPIDLGFQAVPHY